ncbi:serine/threonine protein kinase [Phanerochaete sordida]|uniref:Serine/threonine protein kinase n=1 Tax=Phanerochaete sordida TaxID=48140 RepID=A0A9P3G6C0_9APHY|nr:serine/threonine protein kinase [Phanerochaete sordida]
MSLSLDLSLRRDGHHSLTSVPAFLDDALRRYTSVTFHAIQRICDGDSRVYRGNLDLSSEETIEVVCKIVLNEDSDRLEDEARLYTERMKHLQGTTVPRFYGLFSGTYVNPAGRTRAIRCIIVEEWGSSMSKITHLPMSLRITIIEAVLRIHAAGVKHNDLRFPNILISEDKSEVRIVDFDNASEHTCPRSMPVILYAWEPTLADFGCREIHDFVSDLEIWTSATVRYLGRLHSVHLSPTAEEMFKSAQPDVPDEPEERLLARAETLLKNYATLYGARFPFIGPPGSPIYEGEDAASRAVLEPKVINVDRLEKCRPSNQTQIT